MGGIIQMTFEQVIEAYIQKFGGAPLEMMQGYSETQIKEILTKSLETGKEVQFDYDGEVTY